MKYMCTHVTQGRDLPPGMDEDNEDVAQVRRRPSLYSKGHHAEND